MTMAANKPLCAGELRTRTTLQRQKATNTPDALGHVDLFSDDVWEDVAERWTKVHTEGGREFYRSKQVHGELTHLLGYRYDTKTKDISPRWRIKLGTRTLEVLFAYNVDERNVEMRVGCREAVT